MDNIIQCHQDNGYGELPQELGQEALDNYFDMRQGKAESFQDYIFREEILTVALKKDTAIDLDEKIRGYWLMRTSNLTDREVSGIKIITQGQTQLTQVKKAITQTIVAQKREEVKDDLREARDRARDPAGRYGEAPNFHLDGDSDDDEDRMSESECSGSWYDLDADEQEALISLRDARKKLQHGTKSRRFYPKGGGRTRSIGKSIDELKKVTPCNRCGAIGHWEEDCTQPVRGRKKRSPSAKGRGKSRRFRRKSDGEGRGGSSNYPIMEVYNDGSKTQTSHMKVPPGYAVLDCGAAKSLCGAKPVALMAQTCAREGKRVGDERNAEAIDESYHFRGIGNQIVSSFMELRVPGSIDGKEVSFAPSVTQDDIPTLVGNDYLIPWGCSLHLYPDECRLEIPPRGIDAKFHVTTSNHLLVNVADFTSTEEHDYDVWTSKRGRESEETGTDSEMTDETEETFTDPGEAPTKRTRRGVPRKPRAPRKKPPRADVQLSPALQSELRKLQHAAARGSSASAAEWAKVSRAADKALALLLPDKGPRSMEISTVYMCQKVDDQRSHKYKHQDTENENEIETDDDTKQCDETEQWLIEDYFRQRCEAKARRDAKKCCRILTALGRKDWRTWNDVPLALRKDIERIHRNLGHASADQLEQLF